MSEEFFGEKKVVKSISFEDGLEDKWQGVITYFFKGTPEEARADAPKLGTRSKHFPNRCVLKKRKFSTTGAGETTDVILTYEALEVETDEDNEPSYQLKAQEGSTSILLHPRYDALSVQAKAIAKTMIDGTSPWKQVYYREEKQEDKKGEEVVIGFVIKETLTDEEESSYEWTTGTLEDLQKEYGKDKKAKELFEKIGKGITSYKTFSVEWVQTSYKSGLTGALNRLGRIDPPDGPQPSVGGNWLLSGVSASKTRSDFLWKIDKTWKLSDAGATWDKDLYGQQESSV